MDEISRRSCPWLSEEQITLLQSHQIRTFMDFITTESIVVIATAGFTRPEYELTLQEMLDCLRPAAITANRLITQDNRSFFSTGVQKLDEILKGGLAGGEVLEIYGKYRSGKTQLCLQIAAQFCHRKSSVVYFDLKNDFRATRFLSFCQGVEKDLRHIKIIRSSSFPELISDLDELHLDVSKGGCRFSSELKLIIFDSVPMVIYPAVEEDLTSWRFHEEQFIEKTCRMAELNDGIVIIFVNNATSTRSGWKSKSSGNIAGGHRSSHSVGSSKPAMGKYWLHKPNFRLHVAEHPDTNSVFSAALDKSSRTETIKTFDFKIDEKGINSY